MDPNNPQDQTSRPASGQPTVGPAEPVQPGQMPTVPAPEPTIPTEPVQPETPVEPPESVPSEPVVPTPTPPTVSGTAQPGTLTTEPQGEGGGGTPPAMPTY